MEMVVAFAAFFVLILLWVIAPDGLRSQKNAPQQQAMSA